VKASFILTANGLVLGFLASSWSFTNIGFVLFSAASSILSIICCIMLLWTREYPKWDLQKTWGELIDLYYDETALKRKIYSGIADNDAKYNKIIKEMAKAYHVAVAFFLFSVVILAISLTF